MRSIDGDALYEKTAEWEAQAFAHIEELNRTPLEEMTAEERAEWRRWTAILGERSAFLHDVADAPTIEAEPRWIPVMEKMPEECEEVNITWVNTEPESYYQHIKGIPYTGSGLYCRGHWYWYSATCKDYLEEYGVSQGDEMDDAIKVIAWLPLPEPYKMDEVEE